MPTRQPSGRSTNAKKNAPDIRIGISGWNYAPWRGTFYATDVKQKDELAYASRQLSSIEINGTFYSLQRPSSFAKWYDQTRADFVFSVKGPRFITHMKKLNEVQAATANFFASGVLALNQKLGPILWQFPPNFGFDAERFEAFFKLLPRTTGEAVKLAKKHEPRMQGRNYLKTDADRPIRYTVEPRHETFRCPAFIKMLTKHGVALCVADTARRYPFFEDVTADFVYARLHGDEELYVSGYSDAALQHWAGRIELWRQGKQAADAVLAAPGVKPPPGKKDVYLYFDNDVKVCAPKDAASLARKVGVVVPGDLGQPSGGEHFARNSERARKAWPGLR